MSQINKSTDNNASYDQFILQRKTTLFGPVNNKLKYIEIDDMLFTLVFIIDEANISRTESCRNTS